MTTMKTLRTFAALGLAGLMAMAAPASAEPAAKKLFSAKHEPAAGQPQSIGFYSKGCLAGAAQLPADGPAWQAMRLSRDRRYGHPVTVAFLEHLAARAKSAGIWRGLLVGDISQARGGPMAFGHSSHQVGLDADIWLQEMPADRLTAKEREDFPFRSVLKKGALTVDDRIWTSNYRDLIKLAAEEPQVQRIFVHPGIKKKLCETAGRDRAWLSKVRPYYGHHEHFHVRLFCQPGSENCKPQRAVGGGDGCSELGWWFNVALKPAPKPAKPAKPKPPLMLSGLPGQCRVVLNAPAGDPTAAMAAISAGGTGGLANSYAPAPARVPLPTPRPAR
ncbi:penicillin-insensitive murein endopeptidase [Jiella marina]|uniref:penicillin-insensitive murein endopeptidase n=1 Tax=Jiella sp. LLJ827 TaxID=2917712 RepID=UPI002101BC96|nr:penicillin-insensitive murein endopeptidase [Jiella sp. LLJ827]MCQ0987838.1 penicillin-insensitive murein endopeptidase [Jiella sp. LLJ827]